MRLVIIESPFAGDRERNKRYLNACIRDCLARGESPYASHRMLTDALRDEVPEERTLGINAGFAWRAVADATVVYRDLGLSLGMRAGIAAADSLKGLMVHPIEYRELGANWEELAK